MVINHFLMQDFEHPSIGIQQDRVVGSQAGGAERVGDEEAASSGDGSGSGQQGGALGAIGSLVGSWFGMQPITEEKPGELNSQSSKAWTFLY